MWNRIGAGICILILLACGVYFVYFRHPPPDDILAANKSKRTADSKGGLFDRIADPKTGEIDYDTDDPVKQSILDWAWFIEDMNLVSVGDIFDKCEGDDRIMLGQIVLLPDEKTGGIKSRTFLNFTLDRTVEEGEMYIEIKYNGKNLYKNHWDMCTVEEDMETEDKLISCPMVAGIKRFVKDTEIPGYLPKGTYYTKSWLVDADEKMIVCSFSEITI